jgi:hypothetical protein
MTDRDLLDLFDVGDKVSFSMRGWKKKGNITRFFDSVVDGSKYASIECGNAEWHIPLDELSLIEKAEGK